MGLPQAPHVVNGGARYNRGFRYDLQNFLADHAVARTAPPSTPFASGVAPRSQNKAYVDEAPRSIV